MAWWRRASGQRRREDVERDVRDELEFHREMRRDDVGDESSTASPDHLTKLAMSRDRRLRVWALLSELRADALDSVRRLRRAPVFTLAAIGILAVGLGACSAVFAMFSAAYLKPLPFANGERLVRVQEYSRRGDGGITWIDASAPTLNEIKTNGLFDGAAALRPVQASLRTDDGPARFVSAGGVTEGWSDVLGVQPAIGRLFTAAEERQGSGAGVAVISDHFWRSWFGGRRDVIGQIIRHDGGARAVVGVLPPGYRFPYQQDIWWPDSIAIDERGFFLFGRIAPGVSIESVNAHLDSVGAALRQAWPSTLRGLTPRAKPLRDFIVEGDDRVVVVLAAAVALLMLIVASNAAMMMTTRVVARERELVLRAALGCGWSRQARHIVLETTMIFLGGAGAGVVVAHLLQQILGVSMPLEHAEQLPIGEVPLDWRVLAFTTALAVAAGAACGVLAARRARHSIASASARSIGSVSGRRVLSGLVACELALAAALVCACAVVADALVRIEGRDVGFSTADLVTAQFELSGPRFSNADARLQEVRQIEERFRALPGVTAVGSSTVNPLCCGDWGSRATPFGQFTRLEDAVTVNWRLVTPGFFDTLGLKLNAGRVFDERDVATSEPVVVVDTRFAKRMWPGQQAVGQRVKRGGTESPTPWMRVVGVVSAVEDAGDYTETWYVPYLQSPSLPSSDQLHVWLRVRDGADAMSAIRSATAEVDPALAIIELRTMDAVKRSALAQQRSGSAVAMIFAVVGALLALAGVYGLVSFVVAGDARDMAVRVALGASPSAVMARVVLRIARLATLGAVVGLLGVWCSRPYLSALIGAPPAPMGVEAFALVAALIGCAVVAAALPARRILRLDPREVLQG